MLVNVSTRAQVAPWSALFHKPSRREPKNKMLPSFGSTASRSPLERPSELPPILNGTSVILKVRPWSSERKIAAGLFISVPAAR